MRLFALMGSLLLMAAIASSSVVTCKYAAGSDDIERFNDIRDRRSGSKRA